LSGLLDSELTQQDRQRVELHVVSCRTCRATLDELGRLRQDIAALDQPQPTAQQWSRIMSAITTKTSRALGWILGIVGAGILVGFAIWQFSVDNTVPALIKIGALAAVLGALSLLVSVLLDRLAARKTDRYKDVEL
ncbi:MAG: anti-sigma factor, partial [Planctomycetota bacterium]